MPNKKYLVWLFAEKEKIKSTVRSSASQNIAQVERTLTAGSG